MLRRGLLSAAVVAVFLTALPVVAQASNPRTGRLLVTLSPQQAHTADAVAARHGAKVALPPVAEIRLVVLEPGGGQSAQSLAAELRGDPAVQSVRAERRMKLNYVPNDPSFALQVPGAAPGTSEEWWAGSAGLFAGWDRSTGSGATVAIIDTGIDATHPEFKGKIKRKVDYDRDRSHKGAGHDEVGHGTHVASLACGRADNAFGIAGAGRGCKLLIAKTDLTDGSVASSIIWSVRNRADAINMSFGTDTGSSRSPEIERAIRYAYKRGAVMVAAAADEPRLEQGDPANVLQPTGTGPKLDSNRNRGLTVTAATAANTRASFAGRGSQISLAGYGSYGSAIGSPGLLGAFPKSKTELELGSFDPLSTPCGCRATINGDDRFARLQGTSMAAPIVTAIAAMVRNVNPDLSNREVIRLMKVTSRRAGGWDADIGWGVVDGDKAIATAFNTDATAPRSKVRTARGSSRVKLSWRGTDKGRKGVFVTQIASYDLYRVSPDGSTRRVKKGVRGLDLTVSASAGDGFYTVAVDGAGNREKKPKRPDVLVD